MTANAEVLAVSESELSEFGFPYCGYRSGAVIMSAGTSGVWCCGDCDRQCCVLAPGVEVSTVSFGDMLPRLQAHPRRGVPAHGRPDTRPDGGGEFFRVRAIGLDMTPGCFVCGGTDGLRNNIAAFVQCKAA